MTRMLIKTKKDLHNFLNYEKKLYVKSTKKELLMRLLFLSNENILLWKFIKLLRVLEFHINNNHKIRSLFLKSKMMKYKKMGLLIPPNTCGKGLHIMHIGSILINEKAVIGENCSIHIDTAIVAGGNDHGAPKIGDRCIIGVGAKIVGNIIIGNYCAIGAGAIVTKDFNEDNCTIVGVPAKVINYNGSLNWNKKKEHYD